MYNNFAASKKENACLQSVFILAWSCNLRAIQEKLSIWRCLLLSSPKNYFNEKYQEEVKHKQLDLNSRSNRHWMVYWSYSSAQ